MIIVTIAFLILFSLFAFDFFVTMQGEFEERKRHEQELKRQERHARRLENKKGY